MHCALCHPLFLFPYSVSYGPTCIISISFMTCFCLHFISENDVYTRVYVYACIYAYEMRKIVERIRVKVRTR